VFGERKEPDRNGRTTALHLSPSGPPVEDVARQARRRGTG
jgi:hypothetical protein